MPKRKILFINDSLWTGSGVFRALAQTLSHISYEKYDVTLYIQAGATVEPEARALIPPEVRLIVGEDDAHPYRNVFVFLLYLLSRIFGALRLRRPAARLQAGSRRLIRKRKIRRQANAYFRDQTFHVIVANTVQFCSELASLLEAGKKYVVYHTSRANFFPELTSAAFRSFDGVIAVGAGVRGVLEKQYPAFTNKLLTITNHIDAKNVLEKAKEFSPQDPDGKFRLCSCGRLDKEKGFDLAVEAAKLLQEQGFDFIWYFVGDGENRSALEALSVSCGVRERILFTGFQFNPYPYIGGCDVYVQPSYEEAQPLAVMEAQILGRPIVSTRTVGGEAVLENGKKGVLTPVSAEGLAEGIAALLRDPDRRAALTNLYTPADDLRNKREFSAAWDRLLSE